MSYESAPATALVATQCAACGRPLVDAISVETGMGPECREKYRHADLAGLPPEARDEANRIVHELAQNAAAISAEQRRAACGRLRALGLELLASRVERRLRVLEAEHGARQRSCDVLRGTVLRLFYSSPGFSAGQLRDESTGARVNFAGNLCTREGAEVILRGAWAQDPKWGRQFKVASLEVNQALDVNGLALYLANNPNFAGIGYARARKVAGEFGEAFGDVLMQTPERVAQVAGVPLEVAEALRDEWLRTATTNATATALAAYELTHHQICKIVEKYGNSALEILRENPYALLGAIEGFGFFRVDQVALKVGVSKDHPGRLRAGVVHCVVDAMANGHTYVEWQELTRQAGKLLTLDRLDAREVVERVLDELTAGHNGNGHARQDHDHGDRLKLACVSVDNRLLVALPSLYAAERMLAREVFSQGAYPNPHPTLKFEPPENILPGQAQALHVAHDHGLVLICGGAGVGKTWVVGTIANMYAAANLEIVLCAPTGKAAKRMAEVVGRPASTIHRLLGYNGEAWAADSDPGWRLAADVVVVDEMSMVDATLAYQLFRVLDLKRTAVVLVGDHNQLPPVGPGNPLRDLIERRPIPTVILDEVVRQAGALKVNSTAILQGRVAKTEPPADTDPHGKPIAPPRSPWIVITREGDDSDVAGLVRYLYEAKLESLGFNLLSDVQLLTPTHKGPLGTVALNIELQRLMQHKLWGIDLGQPRSKRGYDFHLHDRVIQTRNNYDLGVMNGTIGTVVGADSDEPLAVQFEGYDMPTVYTAEMGGTAQLALAYALTIHKFQGSEIPCAVVIVHKSHVYQHHRNLLYTGVTRGKQCSIIVGDSWGIRQCAARTRLDERNSFLRALEFTP